MFGLSLVRVGLLRWFVRCGQVLIMVLRCRHLRGLVLRAYGAGWVLVLRVVRRRGLLFVQLIALFVVLLQ